MLSQTTQNFSQGFQLGKGVYSYSEKLYLVGLIYLVSAPASPLLGLLMDKTGRNVTWVFIAVVASIGCHALLAFTRSVQ